MWRLPFVDLVIFYAVFFLTIVLKRKWEGGGGGAGLLQSTDALNKFDLHYSSNEHPKSIIQSQSLLFPYGHRDSCSHQSYHMETSHNVSLSCRVVSNEASKESYYRQVANKLSTPNAWKSLQESFVSSSCKIEILTLLLVLRTKSKKSVTRTDFSDRFFPRQARTHHVYCCMMGGDDVTKAQAVMLDS